MPTQKSAEKPAKKPAQRPKQAAKTVAKKPNQPAAKKAAKEPSTSVAKKAAKELQRPLASRAEPPILSFATPAKFEHWVKSQPADSPGVWLRLGKKAGSLKTLTYQEALDVALAWGWIDGQLKSHDEHSWLRKFVPRRSTSTWSKINRDKALALIAAGKMQAPGLAEVERAKQDGRWQAAYDSPKNAALPADFSAALAKSPRAAQFFETLNGANRYAVLYRVQPLRYKKPETRARKIAELVAMLERGEKIHG